jgi:hypothetical protein
MRHGYKNAFGEESGQTVYNSTQVAAAVYTVGVGLSSQNAVKAAISPRLKYQLVKGNAGPLTAKFSGTKAVIGRFNRSGVPIKTVTISYLNLTKLSTFTSLDSYNVSGSVEELVDAVGLELFESK